MKILSIAAAAVIMSLTLPANAATAAPYSNDFSRLIELSAKRLEISRKVALTKWDSKLPIADPPGDPREKQVIDAAAAEAREAGLPDDLAVAFFADQIEASKLIQFSLMADWRRTGNVPTEPRADLKSQLRPQLDQLRTQFIQALVATAKLRQEPACKEKLVKDTARYVRERKSTALFSIALDRGLARVCGD